MRKPKECAGLALLLLVSLSAWGQAAGPYPTRVVTIVAPFSPGGSTDILARMDAAKLSEVFGHQFIVEHKAGAGGAIASSYTARANPDGHTIHLVSATYTVIPAFQKNPLYDPVNDFSAISLMSLSPNLIVVHPSSPFKSAGEFISYARAHPNEINFGTSGVGSFGHLAGEWLAFATKTKMTFVPYKGLGDALVAVASGQIHVTATAVTSSMPFVNSGRLRAIAVTTKERLKVQPDLMSISESVPGYSWSQWNGYVAPSKTPRPIIERLNTELVKIARSAENVKKLSADGAIPVGSTPDEFAKLIAAESNQWRKLIRDIGLKMED